MPLSRYLQDLKKPEFEEDPAQRFAIENLQRLYEELVAAKPHKQSFLSRIGLVARKEQRPAQGLYIWGGVGTGKTYLMDTFFDTLPFEKKLRIHFHHFMRRVHKERQLQKDQSDPLVLIGEKLAKEARVLCFDEFVVNDVADAVILARLIRVLFDNGVSLVATSNVEPKNLYANGLQRPLFLPAIDMIYEYTDVLNIDSGVDYRLLFSDKAQAYFTPTGIAARRGMTYCFEHLADDHIIEDSSIEIEGRELNYMKKADGVIWFHFSELCDGPRSQNDYIELASSFHSLLLSEVPILDRLKEDQARRFINLVDVLYDHNVKLFMSADTTIESLYQGSRVEFEFQRTISRLQEMQSQNYPAEEHKSA